MSSRAAAGVATSMVCVTDWDGSGSLSVLVGRRPIRVKVVRRGRSRLTLRWRDGQFVVVVPPGVPRAAVAAFLNGQTGWMAARLSEAPAEPSAADGAVFRLWGESVAIVSGDVARWRLEPGRLVLPDLLPDERLLLVRRFLWDQARSVLPGTLERARALFVGVPPLELTVRDMSSRWGSCSPLRRAVRLSVHLVHYRSDCVLAVAAHEVAHCLCSGHGPGFRALLERVMPGERILERTLTREARSTRHWCRR